MLYQIHFKIGNETRKLISDKYTPKTNLVEDTLPTLRLLPEKGERIVGLYGDQYNDCSNNRSFCFFGLIIGTISEEGYIIENKTMPPAFPIQRE